MQVSHHVETSRHRVGRPRRGTEDARYAILIESATRVFLRDGYGFASVDKVATEAGVSTRTIYKRFKNKADLLVAVITRLVDNDLTTVLSTSELNRVEPRQALVTIGLIVTERARKPEIASLLRIVATEAYRFPELAAKMRENTRTRLGNTIEQYFLGQIARGALRLRDPARAASLFMQMICAEVNEGLLFGPLAESPAHDFTAHVHHAVEIFLEGAMPRGGPLAR